MKTLEQEIKQELLYHFLEGGGWDIRIAPSCFNEDEYTFEQFEKEMLTIMYVDHSMPYLETYDGVHYPEPYVKKNTDIPIEEKYKFYKNELNETTEYYYDKLQQIKKIVEY